MKTDEFKRKQILTLDIACRIPLGLYCEFETEMGVSKGFIDSMTINRRDTTVYIAPFHAFIETVKPYLKRITEEDWHKTFDHYLNNHIDFNKLIDKGLAIEVTEENDPYKTIMKS